MAKKKLSQTSEFQVLLSIYKVFHISRQQVSQLKRISYQEGRVLESYPSLFGHSMTDPTTKETILDHGVFSIPHLSNSAMKKGLLNKNSFLFLFYAHFTMSYHRRLSVTDGMFLGQT